LSRPPARLSVEFEPVSIDYAIDPVAPLARMGEELAGRHVIDSFNPLAGLRDYRHELIARSFPDLN